MLKFINKDSQERRNSVNKKKKNILKNRIKLLIFSLSVLICIINIKSINNIKEMKKYEAEDVDPYSLILNYAEADQQFVDTLVSQINMVPKYIINCYAEQNGVIIITNGDLRYRKPEENMKENTRVYGVLSCADNVMYIYNNDEVLETYTVIHEFGHYTDKLHNWISSKHKFKTIYKSEKDIIETEALIDSEREIFAEAFKKLIIGEEQKELEVYEYIRETIRLY